MVNIIFMKAFYYFQKKNEKSLTHFFLLEIYFMKAFNASHTVSQPLTSLKHLIFNQLQILKWFTSICFILALIKHVGWGSFGVFLFRYVNIFCYIWIFAIDDVNESSQGVISSHYWCFWSKQERQVAGTGEAKAKFSCPKCYFLLYF